jgi:hypothetical protein
MVVPSVSAALDPGGEAMVGRERTWSRLPAALLSLLLAVVVGSSADFPADARSATDPAGSPSAVLPATGGGPLAAAGLRSEPRLAAGTGGRSLWWAGGSGPLDRCPVPTGRRLSPADAPGRPPAVAVCPFRGRSPPVATVI